MMNSRYCLCTEASDLTIKYTLTMLYSFFKKNTWFDGELVVIFAEEMPLSNENKQFIRELYPKTIFQKAQNRTVSRYVELFNKKSKYPRELLVKHLGLEAFRLSRYDRVLYISSTNLVLGNISDLLSGEEDIKSTYNTREFPYMTKIKNYSENEVINSSIMVISENLLNELVYQSLVDIVLSNKTAYDGLQKQAVTQYIYQNKYDIKFVPNSYLVSFACFSDPNYRKFKRHESQIRGIEYSIFFNESPTTRHKKVERLWINHYKEYLDSLEQPKKNKQQPPKEDFSKTDASKSENDAPDILAEKSERDKGKKQKALCTIATDNFMKGTLTMLYSFVKNNSWYDGDIVILHSDLHVLSDFNKEKIKKVCDNVVFKKVDLSEYDKVFKRFNKIFSGNRLERFLPSLLTFEVFGLVEEYRKVLYLDSDMVVRHKISDIFKREEPIVVTPDAGKFSLHKRYNTFNGGFLFLNDSLDGKDVKKKIIDFSVTAPNYQLADQSIMNDFFKNTKLFYLDSRYNCLKRCFPDSGYRRFDNRIKIIHYVGAKPWDQVKDRRERQYRRIEAIWRSYYNNMISDVEFSSTKKQNTDTFKRAVYVHLYYQDLWKEIQSHLSKITFDYDLYVTISADQENRVSNSILSFKDDAYVIPIQNRGADFGGFFTALNISFNTDKNYDWILKLHSKKSVLISERAGERWRKTAYQSLIPVDFSKLEKVFNNKHIGMIGSKKQIMGLSTNDKKNGKPINQEHIDFFRERYNIKDDKLQFVGGSMFWMRYDILKDTFLNKRLTAGDFDPGHKPDGTKAHGMERFIANVVRDKGYKLQGV